MIEGQYCIDRFEGSLVEVVGRRTRPWSPFESPERGGRYRAIARRGAIPQGYVSQVQARAACEAAGKRLCTSAEWLKACHGPSPTAYPYGDAYVRGRCNDGRRNPVPRLYAGRDVFHGPQMNDPRLNGLPDTLAPSGRFRRCTNRYGVYDMVGNLHEWVDQQSGRLGVFRGGYYADVRINGEGCNYTTAAHSPSYHDYSTGFRCCADPR
jgi:formylglycine-generating enzyme required for sulfatase activity